MTGSLDQSFVRNRVGGVEGGSQVVVCQVESALALDADRSANLDGGDEAFPHEI